MERIFLLQQVGAKTEKMVMLIIFPENLVTVPDIITKNLEKKKPVKLWQNGM